MIQYLIKKKNILLTKLQKKIWKIIGFISLEKFKVNKIIITKCIEIQLRQK